jgi:hypothetical protein
MGLALAAASASSYWLNSFQMLLAPFVDEFADQSLYAACSGQALLA